MRIAFSFTSVANQFVRRNRFAKLHSSTSTNPVALLVRVEIKSDRLDQFMNIMKEDAIHSIQRENGGCLRFDVLQDPKDKNKFTFYEVYKDENAIAFHKTTPHYQKWVEFKNTGAVVSQAVETLSHIIAGDQ